MEGSETGLPDHFQVATGLLSSEESFKGESSWSKINCLLESNDPVFRHFSLQAMLKYREDIASFLSSRANERVTFAENLNTVTVSDEVARNRYFACFVLSCFADTFKTKDKALTYKCMKTTINLALKAFGFCLIRRNHIDYSEAMTLDPYDNDINENLEYLVYILSALGPFMEDIITNDSDSREGVLQIFKFIIQQRRNQGFGNPLLKSCALKLLHSHLRDTPISRKFIDIIYPYIRGYAFSVSTDKLHPMITQDLSLFFSYWYIRPPDEYIRQIPYWLLERNEEVFSPKSIDLMSPNEGFRRESMLLETDKIDPTLDPELQALLLQAENYKMSDNISDLEGTALSDENSDENRSVEDSKESEVPSFLLEEENVFGSRGGYLGRRYRMIMNDEHTDILENHIESKPDQKELDEDLIPPISNIDTAKIQSINGPREPGEDFPIEIFSALTFQLRGDVIDFRGQEYRQRIHLNNRMDKACSFTLQVHPSSYFSAIPSFGSIQPKKSIPISVRFSPNYFNPDTASSIVQGFIKLRTLDGFPTERIPLVACNGPLLLSYQNELNFGYKNIRSGHSLPLFIKNISPIQVTCFARVSSMKNSSVFEIPISKAVIEPGDQARFEVKFYPSKQTNYSSVLYFSTTGGESHQVRLSGYGGQALVIDNDVLDFGSVQDIGVGAITKSLIVKNIDPVNRLNILLSSTLPSQIKVPKSVMLQPASSYEIPVEIRPTTNGPFLQYLKITGGAYFDPVEIEMRAFIGMVVGFPVKQDIYVPPCNINEKVQIDLPLINFSKLSARCFIKGLAKTGFEVHRVVREEGSTAVSNKSPSEEPLENGNMDMEEVKDDLKPMTETISYKLCTDDTPIDLAPEEVVNLKVSFIGENSGFFRCRLDLVVEANIRISEGHWYLMACCFGDSNVKESDESKKGKEQEVTNSIVDLSEQFDVQPIDASPKPNIKIGELCSYVSVQNPSKDVSEISISNYERVESLPEIQFSANLINLFKSVADSEPVGGVKLVNNTGKDITFFLVISKPYVLIDQPKATGKILANEYQNIRISLQKGMASENELHAGYLACFTFESELDDPSKTLCLFQDSIAIIGMNNYSINVVGADELRTLHDCKVQEIETRNVTLVNMTGSSIHCELNLEKHETTSRFRFNNGGVKAPTFLAPWNKSEVAINFKSEIDGEFQARLNVKYTDPNLYNSFSNSSNRQSFKSKQSTVTCFTDIIEGSTFDANHIRSNLEVIDFGDVLVGDIVEKSVTIHNTGRSSVVLFKDTRAPFHVHSSISSTLKLTRKGDNRSKSLSAVVKVEFRPRQQGRFVEYLSLSHPSRDKLVNIIALRGRAGYHSLSSNEGLPYSINGERNSKGGVIQFGIIDTTSNTQNKRCLEITNTGSLDLDIIKISTPNPDLLEWKVKRTCFENNMMFRIAGVDTDDLCNQIDALRDEMLNDNIALLKPLSIVEVAETADHNETIDWDELDFILAKSMESASGPENRSFKKSSGFNLNNISMQKMQTRKLKPGQSIHIDVQLIYSPESIGKHEIDLNIECLPSSSSESTLYTFRNVGVFQPALHFMINKLNFGLVPANTTKTKMLQFSNYGVVPVHWEMKTLVSQNTPIDSNEDVFKNSWIDKTEDEIWETVLAKNTKRALNQINNGRYNFSMYPIKGVVEPGSTQNVRVNYSPADDLAYTQACDVISIYTSLGTEAADLFKDRSLTRGAAAAVLTGVGGAALLNVVQSDSCKRILATADVEYGLDFGSIKTGTKKVLFIEIKNRGNLDGDYLVENASKTFSVNPTKGTVRPGGQVRLSVSFSPAEDKQAKNMSRIRWTTHSRDEENKTERSNNHLLQTGKIIKIMMTGSGGHPALEVKQSRLDFGTPLLRCENKLELKLHNNGTAEAMATITSPSPYIYTEEDSKLILIPQSGWTTVTVIYKPEFIEILDTFLTVRGVETDDDIFTVALFGKVGAPEFSITPTDALSQLDFDVALINQTHVRTFSVTNIGNADIDFSCAFLRPKVELIDKPNSKNQPEDKKSRNKDPDNNAFKEIFDPRQKEKSWLETYQEDELEEFDPDVIAVEPTEGCFRAGLMIHFTVTYEPKVREVESRGILILKNRFRTIKAEVKGIGGDPMMELDTPLKTVDFGVCRVDQQYERVVNVINPGNVGYNIEIQPDPSDLSWQAIHKLLHEESSESEESMDSRFRGRRLSQRPRSYDRNKNEDRQTDFMRVLAKLGFSVTTQGYCARYGKSPIYVKFKAPNYASQAQALEIQTQRKASRLQGHQSNPNAAYSCRIRLRYAGGYEQLTLRARVGEPKLQLYDIDNTPVIEDHFNFGIRAIKDLHLKSYLLYNSGKLPADFIVVRDIPSSFSVAPMTGRVAPGESLPIQISFHPKKTGVVDFLLQVIYNTKSDPLTFKISGKGGSGVLSLEYLSKADETMQGLDFELVATNVLVEKSFLVCNRGLVRLHFTAMSNSPYFKLKEISDSDYGELQNDYKTKAIEAEVARKKWILRTKSGGGNEENVVNVRATIEANKYVILRVLLYPKEEKMYSGVISLQSEFNSKAIPVRARGGRVNLCHEGELNFHEIACDQTYTSSITLYNTGSIPVTVSLSWQMKNGTREHNEISRMAVSPYTVLLRGTTTRAGRRRLWRWAIYSVKKMTVRGKLSIASQVANMGFQSLRSESHQELHGGNTRARAAMAVAQGHLLPKDHPMYDSEASLLAVGDAIERKIETILEKTRARQRTRMNILDIHKVSGNNEDPVDVFEKMSPSHATQRANSGSAFINSSKEKDNAAEIVERSGYTMPHIQVTPKTGTVSQRIEMEITVSLNCSVALPFEATLIVSSSLPGVEPYLIPVKALPKEVNVIVNDTSTLNFGRQPVGEKATLSRVFTNNSQLPLMFQIKNEITYLTIEPKEGSLQPGEAISIDFSFCPLDDTLWVQSVRFETDCTPPLIIPVYGGGGRPRLLLDNYERFDFGRCMIGKSIPKFLKLGNSGNSALNIIGIRFSDESETAVFGPGVDWPKDIDHRPIKIRPGCNFQLPLIFNPHSEDSFVSILTIETTTEAYSLELMGLGREAVLSLSKTVLEFSSCIVGNAYEDFLEITNAGDLQYPLKVSVKAPDQILFLTSDVHVYPEQFTIAPFEKEQVVITYKPSRPTPKQKTVNALVCMSSIYSHLEVPLKLVAGTADLLIEPTTVDFGHFEVGKSPHRKISFTNEGSMSFSFRIIRSVESPLKFSLSRWEGTLTPGSTCEISVSYTGISLKKHKENSFFEDVFHEELHVETDLIGVVHFFTIRGHCDSSVLSPKEFEIIKLGYCTVGENSTQLVRLSNQGGFPASLTLRPTYPAKVNPKTLTIPGYGSKEVAVAWKPMGGYDLRSTIKIISNVGNFEMLVLGRGIYPVFKLLDAFVDFGVCAIGCKYKKIFSIHNTGKVAMNWSIPALSDCYSVSAERGKLLPNQQTKVVVYFEPLDEGAYPGDFIVESKGRYKIVNCCGVGGKLDFHLNYSNSILQLGNVPCETVSSFNVNLHNKGVMQLKVNISLRILENDTEISQSSLSCWTEFQHMVLPAESEKQLRVYINPGSGVDPFKIECRLSAHEGNWSCMLNGIGYILKLSKNARYILDTEELEILHSHSPDNLTSDISVLSVRDYKPRFSTEKAFKDMLKPSILALELPEISKVLVAPPPVLATGNMGIYRENLR